MTISLGDDARWSIRKREGLHESSARLRSGDVTLLTGLTRAWEHSIERIYRRDPRAGQGDLFGASSPPPLLDEPGRFSITVRRAG